MRHMAFSPMAARALAAAVAAARAACSGGRSAAKLRAEPVDGNVSLQLQQVFCYSLGREQL